jgi:hypothetical protein
MSIQLSAAKQFDDRELWMKEKLSMVDLLVKIAYFVKKITDQKAASLKCLLPGGQWY